MGPTRRQTSRLAYRVVLLPPLLLLLLLPLPLPLLHLLSCVRVSEQQRTEGRGARGPTDLEVALSREGPVCLVSSVGRRYLLGSAPAGLGYLSVCAYGMATAAAAAADGRQADRQAGEGPLFRPSWVAMFPETGGSRVYLPTQPRLTLAPEGVI